MTSQLKMSKGQVRPAHARISGAQNLAIVHLQYWHNVLPDAEDTGGQVPAFPNSCVNPVMLPFQAFLHNTHVLPGSYIYTAVDGSLEHGTMRTSC